MSTPSPSPFMQLMAYSVAHRRRMLLASTCSVLNKIFDLAPPALIGLAVDVVVKGEESWLATFGLKDSMHQLEFVAFLTVIIWGLESIFEYLFQWLWRNLAQAMQHDLRKETYDHIQRQDMAWFQDRSVGRLMSILNDDVNQLERFLDGGANDILQVGTTVVAVSGVFFWFSPGMAGLSLLPIPVILWGSFRFQSRIAPRYADVRETASLVNEQLANNLTGIETIKSFSCEDYERNRVGDLSAAYQQSNRRAIALSSVFSPLIRMAIVVGFVATLVYGGWLTLNNEMEVGTFSVLVFLTQRLLWPLTRLGATFDLYQRAMASTRRVMDLLAVRSSIHDGTVRLSPERVQGSLRFSNVTFGYPGRPTLLKDFDLEVQSGESVAIVGPTGSGKSTLVRLALRLFDPNSGDVLLDGHALRTLAVKDVRHSIGLVSQSIFLFPGTIADNIRYGNRGATDEDVRIAARQAEATSFIEQLPQGFNTLIGERGQRLSGGQRQRICIARALVKNPPILILDEATSAVDNETEAAIQRSLSTLGQERTIFIIAHRLSTIRHVDRIIVLQDGAICQSGTHDELVAVEGLYMRLWRVQTGETEPDVAEDFLLGR